MAGLVVVGALVGGAGVFGISHSLMQASPNVPTRVSSAIRREVSCAASRPAFFPSRALSGHFHTLDIPMSVSPIRTRPLPPTEQPVAYSTFVIGRMLGYVTNMAWAPPYVSAVHPTPGLPLSGAIVSATAGLLEAYQLNTAYTSTKGAEAFQSTETNYTGASGWRKVRVPGEVHGEIMYQYLPDVPGQETVVHVDVVRGLVQVDFYFRGGGALTAASVQPYVEWGVGRLTAACPVAVIQAGR
jgi:hypothetical protein